MTGLVGEVRLPADWHVLDLDPATGPQAHRRLVEALAVAAPHLHDPVQAQAAANRCAALAARQRARGAAVTAVLAGRDETGALAAVLDVIVAPLAPPPDGAAPSRPGPAPAPPPLAADGLAAVLDAAGAPERVVARLDLPAGPAVGVRDVVADDTSGDTVGLAQVWLPLADGRALVVTLTTPCVAELDGLTRLLVAVAGSLEVTGPLEVTEVTEVTGERCAPAVVEPPHSKTTRLRAP